MALSSLKRLKPAAWSLLRSKESIPSSLRGMVAFEQLKGEPDRAKIQAEYSEGGNRSYLDIVPDWLGKRIQHAMKLKSTSTARSGGNWRKLFGEPFFTLLSRCLTNRLYRKFYSDILRLHFI